MWPAAGGCCVCAGAQEQAQEQPANNWQSVGQRVGFTTSVVHACQLVSLAMSQQRNGINNYRKFNHLGQLDFESERDGDGTNFCVFACGIAV